MLGFEVDELIGQNSHAMFHHTKPDARNPYPIEDCPVQTAYKQGSIHRGSDMYWRKDGTNFLVNFISCPIVDAGEISGAVVTFFDISERQRGLGDRN